MTTLERLNNILANNSIRIPDYRRVISPSGNNLSWIKKHLGKEDYLSKLNGLIPEQDFIDLETMLKSKSLDLTKEFFAVVNE